MPLLNCWEPRAMLHAGQCPEHVLKHCRGKILHLYFFQHCWLTQLEMLELPEAPPALMVPSLENSWPNHCHLTKAEENTQPRWVIELGITLVSPDGTGITAEEPNLTLLWGKHRFQVPSVTSACVCFKYNHPWCALQVLLTSKAFWSLSVKL